MVLRRIDTKIGKIELLTNGILKISGNSNIQITLEDMFENDRAFKSILEGKQVPFLTIFGENATIDREAQEYFSNKERSKVKKAEALVTSQIHHKLITLYQTKHAHIQYPIKHFSSEQDAVRWLLNYV